MTVILVKIKINLFAEEVPGASFQRDFPHQFPFHHIGRRAKDPEGRTEFSQFSVGPSVLTYQVSFQELKSVLSSLYASCYLSP
jgi:hypothetical protein